jgi:ribosomal protein RSM22 (predicted rRNA methylase)
MQTAPIPHPLREMIERETADFKGAQLAAAAEALSTAYRAGLPAALSSPVARAAYLVTRVPATYAALTRAAAELPFEPETWLDLGAGPGTAGWVAPCDVTFVEKNKDWFGTTPGRWIEADLRRLPHLEPHEAVSISYALNELAPAERTRLIVEAWRLAGNALILVEPGTVEGFAHIRAARTQLIELGAHLHAPCPHQLECPMTDPDWCHFAVRIERTRLHKIAKGGDLSYEDEKYSYLIALKEPSTPPSGRILRHPKIHSGLIELTLCTRDEGIKNARITKKTKDQWRVARKSDWGGPWDAAAE